MSDMVKCISSTKLTMVATVIPRLPQSGTAATGPGSYERRQDEDSGQIYNVFMPGAPPKPGQASTGQFEIDLFARGFTDLGFRSSANLESYIKGQYNIREVIECFWSPGTLNDNIGRQALVTNIRDKRTGRVLWTEQDTGVPTTFQVQGVTPLFDPFGRMREWISVLTRAEIQ